MRFINRTDDILSNEMGGNEYIKTEISFLFIKYMTKTSEAKSIHQLIINKKISMNGLISSVNYFFQPEIYKIDARHCTHILLPLPLILLLF